ncbi:hypothetical protein BDZ89DRAFT_1141433 [Hymenopellis radicata]|nr:hypothetical protein BDZ89DRAFT_1141433 [Hymenopellis radicata]
MSLFFAVIVGDLAVVRVTADIFIAIPLSEHATDSSAVERYVYNIATSDPRPLLVAFRSNGLTFSERLITAQERLPALTPFITDMDYVSHVVDIEDAEGYKAQITFIIFCSVCGMIVGGCGALLLKSLATSAVAVYIAVKPTMTMERFLDVEAQVEDEEEEDEEEENELPDFIVAGESDHERAVDGTSRIPDAPSSSDPLEDWTEDLLRRYSRAAVPAPTLHVDDNVDTTAIPFQLYPLYRIATEVGYEAAVCRKLRRRLPAGRLHDILFVLAQEPGYIFWSFSSDEPFDVVEYLEGEAAIRHQRSAPIVDEIPISDLPDILEHFMPNSTFPIWCIRCKLGYESMAATYLRRTLPASRDHDRIFVLASSPRSLYWSVSPDPLSIFVHICVKCPAYATNVETSPHFYVGRWVRVLKGRYKDEVGVISYATPTCAAVLVLPHLDLTDASTWTLKRKRGYRPAVSSLFDPERVFPTSLKTIDVERATYEFNGVRYVHGLALVMIPSNRLTVDVRGVDYGALQFFLQSQHPLLSARDVPCILDWVFRPGQHVRRVGDAMVEGVVEEVNHDGVVMFSSGSSIQLGWLEVVKVFFVGDYVKVFAGAFMGREGWVEYTEGSSIHVLNKSRKFLERLTVHANSCDLFPAPELPHNPRATRCKPLAHFESWSVGQHVRVMDEAHRFRGYSGTIKEVIEDKGSPSGKVVRVDLFSRYIKGNPIVLVDSEKVDALTQDDIARRMCTGPAPWLGLPATIMQPGHPFRTYPAIVRDVLIHQSTPSGLMLQLEITTYQGSNPRRMVTVDYDYVIDPETQWELRLKQPLTVEQSAFFPPETYERKRLQIRIPPAAPIRLQEAPRCLTPPPPPERHSSPTWDPAAELPRDLPVAGTFHWTEYTRLGQVLLRVNNVNDGKQIVVTRRWIEDKGCICLFTTRRGKEREIQAQSIEPRAPKARWSGLLVVIHGEYGNIGKLVRPVRQRYEAGITHWTVRVVQTVPGHPDIITDEELVLPSTHFCEVEESGESKRLNEVQAQALKEPSAGHCFP